MNTNQEHKNEYKRKKKIGKEKHIGSKKNHRSEKYEGKQKIWRHINPPEEEEGDMATL